MSNRSFVFVDSTSALDNPHPSAHSTRRISVSSTSDLLSGEQLDEDAECSDPVLGCGGEVGANGGEGSRSVVVSRDLGSNR